VEASAVAQKVCPACNSRYELEVAFCSRDGTPLVHDPNAGKSDLVGQVIADRYRVVRLVGEGGMGQVYEAQHVNINRRFALKLLRREIVTNPEAVARFRQEAWSASSIGHDNIIEIDDFATLPNGSVYLAMEFLEGQALSERMRASPSLSLEEALGILLQVCSGLDAAHSKGIVHRDMKPENVFLARKHGRVVAKILDFGIAKVSGAEGSQSLTRTGTIFGTPHYMSPEQALGRPLDHRSDIYSMGVIMYEAFTGRVPFEAESFMGILTKHITAQPTPPRELAPETPVEIEALILRAMAKEAGDRFQSMSEVLSALTAIAEAYAPGVLTARSGALSAQLAAVSGISGAASVTPAAMRVPTPARHHTPLPSHADALGSSPSSNRRAATPLPFDPTQEAAPVRRSRVGVYLALAGVALGGVGVAAFSLRSKPTTPVAVVATAPAPTPAVPAAPDVTILLDSEPVGAQIFRDGKSLGDTPREIRLEGGRPETVVLVKAGFVTHPVLLTVKGELRRVVHLERSKESKEAIVAKEAAAREAAAKEAAAREAAAEEAAAKEAAAKRAPAKQARGWNRRNAVRQAGVAPQPAKSASKPPPLVAAPTAKPAATPAKRDPYERVVEPQHPAKGGSEIMNY
jgi:serine/threonine-protein kinase